MSATRKPAPLSVCECGHRHMSHEFTGRFPLGRCVAEVVNKGALCECTCTQYHRAESGAPLQPGASKTCNHEILSGWKCDKPIGHTGPHEGHITASTGAPAMAGGMSGAQGWQELPKSNPDGVSHSPEKLFTHSELTTLLERMARLVVQAAIRLAREEDEELRLNHISALLTPAKLQQFREAVERP